MYASTRVHVYTRTHTHTHCLLMCAHRQPELGGTLPHEDEGECSDADSDLSVEQVAVQSKPQWDCESVLSTYSNLYNHPATITEPPSLKGEVGSATASLLSPLPQEGYCVMCTASDIDPSHMIASVQSPSADMYSTTSINYPPAERGVLIDG